MIKRLKDSLTAKLFLITAGMLIVICILTYVFIAWVMPHTYSSTLNSALTGKVGQFVSKLRESSLSVCQPLLDQFARDANANVYITDASHQTVMSSAGSEAVTTTETTTVTAADIADNAAVEVSVVRENDPPDQYSGIVQVASNDTAFAFALGYQFRFRSDLSPYTLLVTVDMQTVNQAVEALRQVFPWLVLVIIVVSSLAALYFSRYITRPVRKLNGIAKRMSALEFDWRCDDTRTDEIGTLGKSLNGLAEKLSQALSDLREANLLLWHDIDQERELERQRLEFFSAVSHELKTPITVIKGQLEGMLGNVGVYQDHETYLAKCLSVTCVMENTVQEILMVTRLDSFGFAPQMRRLNLTELVQEQLNAYRDLMEQKYLSLQTDLVPGLMISGDEKLLRKAVSNLLANAARYSPAEETIRVKTSTENGAVVLSIDNTGVHIPETAIPHLFEAFFRVEQSRNRQTGGSGLGLYLVSRIAKLHGAECRVENAEKGVCVTLSFPAADR